MKQRRPHKKGSWQPVAKWYGKQVGKKGHYYHQNVVLPGVTRHLEALKPKTVLDLACGQGVLARRLPKECEYLGIDISSDLIQQARQHSKGRKRHFQLGDITEKLQLNNTFDCVTCILALQNVADPTPVFANAASHLAPNGHLLFVINHPCFRVPRQSGWGVDEHKKSQYRRVERYLSPLEIPIQAHPSKGEKSAITWSYHHPLEHYMRGLQDNGLLIEALEEWCSDKKSEGGSAKMEDRARREIPLFMAIRCRRLDL